MIALLKTYIDMSQEMGWSVLEFDVSLIGSAYSASDVWLTTPWIEANWDEIKYLDGYPGEYIVLARRKGQKWTIGAINVGAARTVTVPLNFLSENYKSLLLCEDDKTNPRNQCTIRTVSIENEKSFTFEMAENGGFVAIAKKIER